MFPVITTSGVNHRPLRYRRAGFDVLVVAAFTVAAAGVFDVGRAEATIFIDTVTVGNPGNSGELSGAGAGGFNVDRICGAVGYTYDIGQYEVTARQYTAFLNATAATDAYGLYNTDMASDLGCKIQRSGTAGDYTYTVDPEWADRPVNYVSWGDAARFANWLHNDQPIGAQDLTTTEDGAYFLDGAISREALLAVSRKADWKWAIPTEDEWYKAAFHKNDGVTANYFDYPTSSDTAPSNDLVEPTDPGNNATFRQDGDTIGLPYYRTEVGAHENSVSPYGTFDQGGNVREWNEEIIGGLAVRRGLRAGSIYSDSDALHAANRGYGYPDEGGSPVGFRVVKAVPEPSTLLMWYVGVFAWLLIARRRVSE